MLLVLPGRDLTWRLSREKAPWIVNLPADIDIVGCVHTAAGDGGDVVAFFIRSKTFPRIAQGAPIPRFTPQFNGLLYQRRR
jgi:hypothetical protein